MSKIKFQASSTDGQTEIVIGPDGTKTVIIKPKSSNESTR